MSCSSKNFDGRSGIHSSGAVPARKSFERLGRSTGGRVGAQNRDLAGEPLATEHLGRRMPRRATADDDDRAGVCRRRARRRRAWLLAEHDEAIAARLDVPASDRTKRRRLRFARAQVEARVVPGTVHRLAVEKAVGERPAVVRAGGADCKDLFASSHQQDGLARCMPEEHRAVAEVARGDAAREVGACQLSRCAHEGPLSISGSATQRSISGARALHGAVPGSMRRCA